MILLLSQLKSETSSYKNQIKQHKSIREILQSGSIRDPICEIHFNPKICDILIEIPFHGSSFKRAIQ